MELLEDTNGVIRSRNSKDRQCNGHKEKQSTKGHIRGYSILFRNRHQLLLLTDIYPRH